MSWIDKKFKDALGKRGFSEGAKAKGKADLAKMLDAEFPLATPGVPRKGAWYSVKGGLVLVAAIGALALTWAAYNGWSNEAFADGQSGTEAKNEATTHFSYTGSGVTFKDLMTESPIVQNFSGTYESTQLQVDENDKIRTNDVVKNTSGKSQSKILIPANRTVATGVQTSVSTVPTIIKSKTAEEVTVQDDEENVLATTTGGSQVEGGIKSSSSTDGEKSAGVTENIVVNETINTKGENTSGESQNTPGIEANIEEEVDLKTESFSNSDVALVVENENGVVVENGKQELLVGAIDSSSIPVPTDSAAQDVAEVSIDSLSLEDRDTKAESKSATKSSNKKLSNLAFADFENGGTLPSLKYPYLNKGRFSLAINAHYYWVNKQLSGNDKDLMVKREKEEEGVLQFSAGADLDYFMTKNWTIGVGIGWMNYGENLKYSYQFSDSIVIDGRYDSPKNYSQVTGLDSARIIDAPFEGHWSYNFTHSSEDSLVKSNNGNTQWRYLEVPIMLGYRFGNGRLKPWVKAGVLIGVPLKQEFRYALVDGSLETVESPQTKPTDLQYSARVQLGVDYFVSRHLSLRLNGLGSYQITSAVNHNSLNQRYYLLGASLGVVYNF